MPGRHKAPLLGWHPPAELAAWAREEAERRGGGRGALSGLLTEALRRERERVEGSNPAEPEARLKRVGRST